MNFTDRLANAGFDCDPHGIWTRTDDVFVTTITQDEPGLWLATIRNTEVDEDFSDHEHVPCFRLDADTAEVKDVGFGIDADTATILTSDLRRGTECCGAETTFVEDVHCCKACYEEVAL